MQEKKAYDKNKVNVEELYTQDGVFEDGERKIPFKTAIIKFTIGDYPLVFTAKVDKAIKGYLEEAYNNA